MHLRALSKEGSGASAPFGFYLIERWRYEARARFKERAGVVGVRRPRSRAGAPRTRPHPLSDGAQCNARNTSKSRIRWSVHALSTAHQWRFASVELAPDSLYRRLLHSFRRSHAPGVDTHPIQTSSSAAICAADRRITPSLMRGQRNLPPSSRLANRHSERPRLVTLPCRLMRCRHLYL